VRVTLRAAESCRVVRVVGSAYRLLAVLAAITPRSLMRWIIGRVFAPRRSAPSSPSTCSPDRLTRRSRSLASEHVRPDIDDGMPRARRLPFQTFEEQASRLATDARAVHGYRRERGVRIR
jgi:hypothetical protein